MDYQHARRALDDFLRRQFGDQLETPEMGTIAAPDEFSKENNIAYIFGVNTVKYFETRNPLDGLIEGAVIVPKDGSSTHWAPTIPPTAQYLDEVANGTRSWASTPLPGADVEYYALLGGERTRDHPSGLVRRKVVDQHTVDEAFTRNLRWEATEHFERLRVGHDEVEHIKVTEREAEQFIQRMKSKLGG